MHGDLHCFNAIGNRRRFVQGNIRLRRIVGGIVDEYARRCGLERRQNPVLIKKREYVWNKHLFEGAAVIEIDGMRIARDRYLGDRGRMVRRRIETSRLAEERYRLTIRKRAQVAVRVPDPERVPHILPRRRSRVIGRCIEPEWSSRLHGDRLLRVGPRLLHGRDGDRLVSRDGVSIIEGHRVLPHLNRDGARFDEARSAEMRKATARRARTEVNVPIVVHRGSVPEFILGSHPHASAFTVGGKRSRQRCECKLRNGSRDDIELWRQRQR